MTGGVVDWDTISKDAKKSAAGVDGKRPVYLKIEGGHTYQFRLVGKPVRF